MSGALSMLPGSISSVFSVVRISLLSGRITLAGSDGGGILVNSLTIAAAT